jgi:oligopeptide/dipeptide ABC transporter ATP-binding protein
VAAVPNLLEIRGLRVVFAGRGGGEVAAVDGVDLDVRRGETLALVGESGCGKSLTALAVMRLTPPAARVEGRIVFMDEGDRGNRGRDLLACSEREMRRVRGARISMIFQEPMSSLNPVFSVGEQVAEVYRVHAGDSRREARRKAVEALRRVGIADADRRALDPPHQMSGGMCQRVMIAMALAAGPALILADEPTTALDVTIQAQILALLRDLSRETGASVLLITHDMGVVAEVADRVAVMYAGQIVEEAPVREAFADPRHPYTQGLMRAVPVLGRRRARLAQIAGVVPAPGDLPPGCRFEPRCPLAGPACRAPVGLHDRGADRRARCVIERPVWPEAAAARA